MTVQHFLPGKLFLISPMLLIQNYFLKSIQIHVNLGCTILRTHPAEKKTQAPKFSRIPTLA